MTSPLKMRREVFNYTAKQMEAAVLFDSPEAKFNLYGGAMGGGKSYFLRCEAVTTGMRISAQYGVRNFPIMLACETFPVLKDRQISKIEHEFPDWLGKLYDKHRVWGNCFLVDKEYGGFAICLRNLDDFNKYKSSEFVKVFIDELTHNPYKIFKDMRHRLRWPGVPDFECKFYGASNPGGIGHAWVKQLWIDRLYPDNLKSLAPRFMFVQAKASDNPHLSEEYEENTLGTLEEDERKAYQDGDWNVFTGQAFSEWSTVKHVIAPLPVPDHAPMYMTMDWGFGKPFSIGWWWVDADGRIYRCREWYGWNQTANQGLRIPDHAIAEGIVTKEKKWGWEGRKIIRLAGPDCFSKKPDYRGGGQGPSTQEEFAKHNVFLNKGDPSRELKIRAFRERLTQEIDGKPMMLIYDTCKQFIRTVPSLIQDDHNVEDIDTNGEDHVYDEACHIMMARPLAMRRNKPEKSYVDQLIEEAERPKNDDFEHYAAGELIQTMQEMQGGDEWNNW